MPTTKTISAAVELAGPDPFNEAEVAATAFLARYSGRTLEAYRDDLRSFFEWASGSRCSAPSWKNCSLGTLARSRGTQIRARRISISRRESS